MSNIRNLLFFLDEDERYLVEERAAIYQYDAGVPEHQALAQAYYEFLELKHKKKSQ